MPRYLLPALFMLLSHPAYSQSNVRPGTDARVGTYVDSQVIARDGTYPDGLNAIAIGSDLCNEGSVDIPTRAPMEDDHPVTAFLLARKLDGRFEQISQRNDVFHHFFALSGSACSPCQNPSDGSFLGVGCTDSHSTAVYADRYWLGHPDEVNPWLGIWDPVCSRIDRGFPPVGPPFDCDGVRSDIDDTQLDPLDFRTQVSDDDLARPHARYFIQIFHLIRGEPEAVRFDNLAHEEIVPWWNGSNWFLAEQPGTMAFDSVLYQWQGAQVHSSTNGEDDGRLYIGIKVLDQGDGFYQYNYAIHNRDSNRGVRAFRIPLCSDVTIRHLTFHDIDRDPTNEWSSSRTSNELIFHTEINPLRWNAIYSFGFEANRAPLESVASIIPFDSGQGKDLIRIQSLAPSRPLNLTLSDHQLQEGDSLRLDAAFGMPSNPLLLALVSLDGSPLFRPLIIDSFESDSRWNIEITIPMGISGLEFGLQAIGISECGEAVESPVEILTIL